MLLNCIQKSSFVLNLARSATKTFTAQQRSYASVRITRTHLLSRSPVVALHRRTISTTMTSMYKVHEAIVQSDQDKRAYRGLTLENGIKCLLISDPSTDRSAAAVDVNVGYLLDPKEFPGLAHFCEHMLFMGSEKYPGENTYSKFIEDHAGGSNAYTSTENTNYHFEVATPNFKEALDIFAQFFISPLFSNGSVDREINAVDSENQKNLQIDAWRLDQLEKSTCRPDHPYSKFGTGNLTTLKVEPEKLGLNVRDELIAFHTKYYSANLMTLCLLGKESLSELEQYATEIFSLIPNKNLPKHTFPANPYGNDTLANVYSVVPVQDMRHLMINWQIPDNHKWYRAMPAGYISHLIGHEGAGSLLSQLKRKGWCNNLQAGSRGDNSGFDFFNLTVDLTEEGAEHTDEIMMHVYQYLNLLRSEKPARWIFDEINQLGKISFTFKDKEKPDSYVSRLATDVHTYAMEDVLFASYYPSEFKPELIEELYQHLVPERMKVCIVSKKFEKTTDQVEKWYNTEYKVHKLSQEQLERLQNCGLCGEFKLPAKNDFVPSDLSLVKHEDTELPELPRIVYKTPLSTLWYKEDTKFLLPKAVVRFEIRNPICYYDPVHVNMTNMFRELIYDSLTEETYAAELAGLKYHITPTNYGLNFSLSGFSDKMNVLLEMLLNKIVTFKVSKERFEILKESYQRNLMNFEAEQTYKHAVYYMTLVLSEKGWSKQQLLECVNDYSIDDLQAFIPKLLTQGLFINSLVFGNITKSRAIEFVNTVQKTLEGAQSGTVNTKMRSLQTCQMDNFRQVKLPKGSHHVFMKNNTVHKTASIEVYFQCGTQNTRNNALVELFCQIINEASFNVLRTQEQLGYIVASGVRNYGGVHGVRFIIQSDRSPAYLDERIENFINLTKETLEKMTDEELKVHVDALALNKLEEPKRMSQQAEIYWNEIISQQYNFDRERIEVEELRKLTKSDVIDFFEANITPDSKIKRKLAIYIHPPEMNADLAKDLIKATVIEDLNEWRRSMPLYQLPKPYITHTAPASQ